MFDRLDRWLLALFGRTTTQERFPDDVDALVDRYESVDSTKLLLEFGRALLSANDSRVAAIDSKATMLVGYSTAVLAFMVGRDASFAGEPVWRTVPILLTAVCAGAGCMWSGLALRAARNWKTMGEATWFPTDQDVAGNPDKLGRWYLKAMHQSLQDNHRITNQKADQMIRAQLAVAGAGIFLGLTLMGDVVTAYWR